MSPETVEFIGLLKVSRWNAAEVARRLHTTRATVSRYLSGKIPVPRGVMELFKFVIAAERPGALAAVDTALKETGVEDWERKTIEELRWLHKDDRAQVIAVMKTMIENMPKRPPIKYDSKGKTPSSVEETLALAEAQKVVDVLREDAGGSGGAAPNVPKGPRRGAAGDGSKAKTNPANAGPQKNPRT